MIPAAPDDHAGIIRNQRTAQLYDDAARFWSAAGLERRVIRARFIALMAEERRDTALRRRAFAVAVETARLRRLAAAGMLPVMVGE